MSDGIDLSNRNEHPEAVDWTGVSFAICKTSQGAHFTDHTFGGWASLAATHGAVLGAYHFAEPDVTSAAAEVEFFLPRRGAAVLLALDVESRTVEINHQTHETKVFDPLSILGPVALANWTNEWCSSVQLATGIKPYVYCNRSYLTALTARLGDWPIWLATATGAPGITSFAGRAIAIEQWGSPGGVDHNTAFIEFFEEYPMGFQDDVFSNFLLVRGHLDALKADLDAFKSDVYTNFLFLRDIVPDPKAPNQPPPINAAALAQAIVDAGAGQAVLDELHSRLPN